MSPLAGLTALAAFVAASAPPPQAAGWSACNRAGTLCAAFTPFDDVTAAVERVIGGAKKSVTVAMFNVASPDIAGALLARAHAGVDVTVLVDLKRPGNPALARLAADPSVHFVRVPSLRGGGPQMHEKLVVVDDDTVVAGTGNLTGPALVSSVESWLLVRDPAAVAAARAELDALVARVRTACAVFGRRSPRCPEGEVVWDDAFSAYARTGRFRPRDVRPGPRCASFVAGKERLEAWPVDRRRADVAGCVRDPRFAELARLLAPKAPRPSLVADALARLRAAPAPPPAAVRFLSSRTVDVEEVYLQALARPRDDPWVLAALSRLHDKNLVEAFAEAGARGTRVRLAVGAFQRTDAAGTASGERILAALPSAAVVDDGFLAGSSLFHDKSVVVGGGDGARLFFSSANWSAQALTRSDESFFVVDDPAIVAAFVANLLRARALAGLPVDDDVRFFAARGFAVPTPVVIVRARGRPAHLELDGAIVPLRSDGGADGVALAGVRVGAPRDAAVVDAEGARVTVRLAPHGLVSVIDVALPPSESAP